MTEGKGSVFADVGGRQILLPSATISLNFGHSVIIIAALSGAHLLISQLGRCRNSASIWMTQIAQGHQKLSLEIDSGSGHRG